jgi:hypothetical protein
MQGLTRQIHGVLADVQQTMHSLDLSLSRHLDQNAVDQKSFPNRKDGPAEREVS